MTFRKDINGLRALAVIAVVLYHFNPNWMPGGFAGVDVFFVISGYLMTGIIFRNIEKNNFSILHFYLARANRIVPALAVLCVAMMIFGWFYLSPNDFKTLNKHVVSSITFLSNILYWTESGYFDANSHQKWLLHTWSLSVEWQFYIIYPFVLVLLRQFLSVKAIKIALLIGTVIGFVFCIIVTYRWPNAAYFLLPSRAWEMMAGGLAYLYPFNIKEERKRAIEWAGFVLIVGSYFFISKDNHWPGYLACLPVFGTYLIIQAQRNDSVITSNAIFQRLGTWSYSIYLWHWPFVVAMYYFSLSDDYIYVGVVLSLIAGFLSHKYIENIKFKRGFVYRLDYLRCKPLLMIIVVAGFSGVIFYKNGLIELAPPQYQRLIKEVASSPYRERCHIDSYQLPAESCEYFGSKVSWAVLGDSHSTEIAFALAENLKKEGVGLKQLSFSACKPSYLEGRDFSKCAKWYNEAVNY
ncbi:acyltransferase family protein, partial [Aliivibrio kagoshimensis]|uniref:acyltransferase family protein n=1 Tax=Aliivibrio kagoshimensis TaxID=2910230 RepID=UPI003D0CAF4D